jgi:hypothetical protein
MERLDVVTAAPPGLPRAPTPSETDRALPDFRARHRTPEPFSGGMGFVDTVRVHAGECGAILTLN